MPAPIDFSDLFFTDHGEYLHVPLPEDLNCSDTTIVRWLTRVTDSFRTDSWDVEGNAWLLARMLCNGGLIVWLAQERDLLDRGLRDLLGESSFHVPEPWSGFLYWCSSEDNTRSFLDWPRYDSSADEHCPHHERRVSGDLLPNRRARRQAARGRPRAV